MRILFVSSSPDAHDSPMADRELREIRRALTRSKTADNVTLATLGAATIDDLRHALLNHRYEVVHISAHGHDEGILFEAEDGSPQLIRDAGLSQMLAACGPPTGTTTCVILSVCHGDHLGERLAAIIPHVIAIRGRVSAEACIRFSRGFYDALGAGQSFTYAYHEGVRASTLTHEPSEFDSVHYCRRNIVPLEDDVTDVLVVEIQTLEFRAVVFFGRYITVGRSRRCAVAMPAAPQTLSKRHAIFKANASGYQIVPFSAHANVSIDGRRVHAPQQVTRGQMIQLSRSITFEVMFDADHVELSYAGVESNERLILCSTGFVRFRVADDNFVTARRTGQEATVTTRGATLQAQPDRPFSSKDIDVRVRLVS